MLCVTSAAFYQLYTQRMAEERVAGLQLAHLVSEAMSLWLDDQVSLVRTMAQTPTLREACAQPDNAHMLSAATSLLRSFHGRHPSYTLMALISFKIPPEGLPLRNNTGQDVIVHMGQSVGDSRGNVSVGVGGLDFSYIAAIHDGATGFISEAKINSVPGLPPVFVVATPVYTSPGVLVGALITSVTLGDFSYNFSKDPTLNGTANMEIVDQRGRFVAHSDPSRVLNDEHPPQPVLLEALKQGKKHFSIKNESGHTLLYSAVEVAPRNGMADRWWVLFSRDLHDVLAELHAPLLSLGMLFLLLFVLVAYLMRKMAHTMRQIVSDSTMQTELAMSLKIKQTLQAERTTLRSILDNIQGIVFLRDTENRYVIINSQFTTILGMTQDVVEGKTDDDLLPPDLAAFCRATDAAAKALHGPYYFEQSLPAPDGSLRDYLFSKEVLLSEDGAFNGMLGVGIDVTLLKQTQRELSEAKGKAEEANMAKSVFLSTMSHEIRTPMNAIIGFAHLFGRTALSDAQKEYLQKIHMASASLLSIINNVLDLSKIESGKLELEHVPFRLNELLQTVAIMAEHATQPKGISFTLEVDPATPLYFMGDSTRVQQILLNMVNNAVKFTKEGGVRLHVAPAPDETPEMQAGETGATGAAEVPATETPPKNTPEGNASLNTTVGQDEAQAQGPSTGESSTVMPAPPQRPAHLRVCFCISDTGIGMSAEQQKNIFDPFVQADASTTRKYGGTGLGLSICRELVELMGGSISLHSTIGQGATFRIILPLEETRLRDADLSQGALGAQGGDPTARDEAQSFAGYGVLLVEDNAINQEIARALLENLGLTVDVAEDGQQALDFVRLRRYDLIFMDIQMPHMDGLESTRCMRRMGKQAEDMGEKHTVAWLSTVPIIAMTANAMQEDKNNCLTAGMNAHLGKPLDPALLQDTLRRWLGALSA